MAATHPADPYHYNPEAIALLLAAWALHAASHRVGYHLLRQIVLLVIAPSWRPRVLRALDGMEREVAA